MPESLEEAIKNYGKTHRLEFTSESIEKYTMLIRNFEKEQETNLSDEEAIKYICILKASEMDYKLEINIKNGKRYTGFLKRQLDAHPDYNIGHRPAKNRITNIFPYRNLMVDKLLIFLYLMGERKVKGEFLGYNGKYIKYPEGTPLDTDEKLRLLKQQGVHQLMWDDSDLGRMFSRRRTGKSRFGMLGYAEVINEVGRDPEVKELWGREITYKDDAHYVKTPQNPKKNTNGHISGVNLPSKVRGKQHRRIVDY